MSTFKRLFTRSFINSLLIKFMVISCIIPALLVSGSTAADNSNNSGTNSAIGKDENVNPALNSPGTEVLSSGVLGRSLSATEINALDSHIFADGAQLPDGQGTIQDGKNIYQQQCASCHGGMGEGGSALELAGDRTLLTTEFPDKGIGVYWPYAPTLFQYIQRAMPPEQPGLLTDDELYSLIGYLLYLNDLLPETGTLNGQTLAEIKLPNRDGFVDKFTFSNEK